MATAVTPTPAHTDPVAERVAGTSETVFLAVAVALLVGTGAAFLSALVSGDQKFMLLALALALPATVLAIEFRAGRPDVFAPINFVLLGVFIGVSARTSYIVLSDSSKVDSMLLLGKSSDVLAPALLIIALGLLSLVVGYYTRTPVLPVHRLPIFNARRWNSSRVFFIVAAITLLAAFSTSVFIEKQGLLLALSERLSAKRGFEVSGSNYRAALGYYRWGSSLVSLAFLVALTWLVHNRKRFLSLPGAAVALLGLTTAVFPLLVSSRTQLLSVAVYALLIYHYSARRISMRILGVGLAVIISAFVFLGALRASKVTVEDFGKQTLVPDIVTGTMENRSFLGVSKTAHIINGVPEQLDYQGGRTFALWLLAPVPREIWPEKPAIRIGGIVAEKVFGYRDINIGIPPGFIAEVYLNFGVVMVPVALFLFGFALRTLYDSFLPSLKGSPGLLLLYLFVTFPLAFTLPGGDFSGVALQIIRDVLPLMLIIAFVADDRPATEPE